MAAFAHWRVFVIKPIVIRIFARVMAGCTGENDIPPAAWPKRTEMKERSRIMVECRAGGDLAMISANACEGYLPP